MNIYINKILLLIFDLVIYLLYNFKKRFYMFYVFSYYFSIISNMKTNHIEINY